MTIVQLNCFIEVASCLNFTEAAKRLNIVQSVVSHHISELENELKVKLFTRNNKTVCLTYSGELLLEQAYDILQRTNSFSDFAVKLAQGINGKLKIGFPWAQLLYPIGSKIAEFGKENPNIYILFERYMEWKIGRCLRNRELDVGFMRYDSVRALSDIEWKPLYREPLCAVVGENDELAECEQVNIKQLKGRELFILSKRYETGWYDMVMDACRNANYTPIVNEQITDVFSICMMVRMGKGFTILPKGWQSSVCPGLHFIDLEGKFTHELGMAWNKNISNECVKLFLATVEGECISDKVDVAI